jgi:hypothetical protein
MLRSKPDRCRGNERQRQVHPKPGRIRSVHSKPSGHGRAGRPDNGQHPNSQLHSGSTRSATTAHANMEPHRGTHTTGVGSRIAETAKSALSRHSERHQNKNPKPEGQSENVCAIHGTVSETAHGTTRGPEIRRVPERGDDTGLIHPTTIRRDLEAVEAGQHNVGHSQSLPRTTVVEHNQIGYKYHGRATAGTPPTV